MRRLATVLILTLAAGAVAAQDAPLVLRTQTKVLGLYPQDVARAELVAEAGYPVVRVELQPEVADALTTFTAGMVGRRVDFIFCGEVLMRPRLRSPLDEGRFTLGGNLGPGGDMIVAILQGQQPCPTLGF